MLGVDPVGINDDFFDLGGHSLLAIKIISQVQDELQIEIPLRILYENSTITRLAKIIQSFYLVQQKMRDQNNDSEVGREEIEF